MLPENFVKTRHYGLWASGRAQQGLQGARPLLAAQREQAAALRPAVPPGWEQAASEAEQDSDSQEEVDSEDLVQRVLHLCGIDIWRCPVCQTGRMMRQPLPLQPTTAVAGTDTS